MSHFDPTRARPLTAALFGSVALVLAVPAVAQDAPVAPPADNAPPPAEEAPSPANNAPVPATAAPVSPASPGAETAAPAPAPITNRVVRSITIVGNERLEPETVRSYLGLAVGDSYDRNRLDNALKALFATDLFGADTFIRDRNGDLTVEVQENPVVNRIILEGNKAVKEDKIAPEIRLAPRQIFTRAKARSDVARIIELYRRQGRFAASVEPLIVPLDQNRVDVVFDIQEGPKSKVRRINFVGNEKFSDGVLRGEIATREAKFYRIFTSNDTYDPDRSAYDGQVLRQFYLTEGYADFRVVSSVAELTPNNKDFVITYVIEEGERYQFGEIDVESEIRAINEDSFRALVPIQTGDPYNAKRIEDTIESLTETAGLLGFAFADVRPVFNRNRDTLTMDVSFVVRETPRVYVERIDINGNVLTRDKVVRREFRLVEGDAFNSFRVRRSQARIQSLGFFQEGIEIEQKPGSGPD
ncbi:MAG: outer membrane protein assembly factor BamA, partial [Pseudomonadota bacterium]